MEACNAKDDDSRIDLKGHFEKNKVIIPKVSGDSWFIGDDTEFKLKEKIESIGTPLKDWDVTINYGIKTGHNDAFIIDTEKRNEILNNCATEEERERTEKIIKPILRGRDIKRYEYNWADIWIIGTFPALNLNIKDYPAIEKYFLDNFDKRKLEQTGKNYGSFKARKFTHNDWFETQDQIGYYQDFEKEKIVYAEISNGSFCYDNSNYFIANTGYIINGENVKYLCALLNSSFITFIYKRYYSVSLGESSRWLYQDIIKLPIPQITDNNRQIANDIEDLVDKIIESKKKLREMSKNALASPDDIKQQEKTISVLDKLINNKVYSLYSLTPDEISLIESSI